MRKLLIVLGVLVLLVVGVDIGGRAFAEAKAGEAISAQTGSRATTVNIHGFSFLAQALPGHYQHITLTAPDVTAGPITGIAATIELYDVGFPISDAVKGNTSNLHAAQVQLHAQLPAARLAAALPQAGVRISAGPSGAIRVSTTVTVSGQPVPVTGDLVPSFASGVLHLNATGVTAAGIAVPDVQSLTKNLSVALPLKDLPFTVQAATVTSSGSDIVLTATANDVRIAAATA